MRTFGEHGAECGQFNHPSGIAISPRGEIVVADYQNDRVQVFTPTGAPSVLPPASCVLPPASCPLRPASCLLPPASCVLPPAS